MNLLEFSQQPTVTWPVTIIWPAGSPIEAMPAGVKTLPDGRLRAVYRSIDELRRSVHTLALVKQAQELGGHVVTERQAGPPRQLALLT